MKRNTTLIVVFVLLTFTCTAEASLNQIEKPIVLYNCNLINSKLPFYQDSMCMVIEGNLIKRIVKTKNYKAKSDEVLLNMTGKYVIPGLINGHVHLRGLPDVQLTNALKWGITTIRSMGDDVSYIKLIVEATEKGLFQSPSIYYSAGIGGTELFEEDYRTRLVTPKEYKPGEAPWLQMINDSSNIEQMIKKAKACGATGIKLLNYIKPDEVKKIVVLAHEAGLKVWSHPHLTFTDSKEIANCGVDLITHTPLLLAPIDWNLKKYNGLSQNETYLENGRIDSILSLIKENNIYFEPTISMYNFLLGKYEIGSDSIVFMKKNLTKKLLKKAWEMGIEFVAGTDLDLPQSEEEIPHLFQELYYFSEVIGMKPVEAIRSATYVGAKAIGIEESYGSIEEGKIADLVILERNPIHDIRNLESTFLVIKHGELIYKNQNSNLNQLK